MEVNKSESDIIQRALKEWQQNGELTPAQTERLGQTINIKRTELAHYFFIIALSCTLLAFGAIFIDDKLLEKIKTYFSLNNLIIALFTAAISIVWFWYVNKHKQRFSEWMYEVYMVLGGLAALTSLVYICKEIATGSSYAPFLLIAAILLFILSIAFRSLALWTGAILSVMGWYGLFSTEHSTINLFLGMNYPVRFTVLGLLVIVISFIQLRLPLVLFAQRITYVAGFIIFFTGLWGVSIFGNFNDLEAWSQVRQTHVLVYAIIFGAISVITLFLGVKYKDDVARDFGVLFILVNLYTRYFEYFWDTMNKGLFFLVLAITFGLLGRWLERKKRINKSKG